MTSLHFLGDIPVWFGLVLSLFGAVFCYAIYRRETARAGLAFGRTLPALRSIAVALVILMLVGPSVERRWKDGQPGQLTFLIDDSESMRLTDGQSMDRYDRALNGLLSPDNGLLELLKDQYEIRVLRSGVGTPVEVWSSSARKGFQLPDRPADWRPESFAATTALGEIVDKRNPESNWILMTDGCVNQGPSLVEATQRNLNLSKPIFTVGFGSTTAAEDLAFVSIEHADRLFRKDRLSGKVLLQDRITAGRSFSIQATHLGKPVWSQTLTTESSGQRAVSFDFSMEALVEQALSTYGANDASQQNTSLKNLTANAEAVPIELDWEITGDFSETDFANNKTKSHLLGTLRRAHILLIDGRSRWESRYLKNMFERDPFWKIDIVQMDDDNLTSDMGIQQKNGGYIAFPETREQLFDYDLIILGEIAPSKMLNENQQGWILDFVSETGGGLILIDGHRGFFADAVYQKLKDIFPVQRSSESNAFDGKVQLTHVGRALTAMKLEANDEGDAATAWEKLPSIHAATVVVPKPGAETIATLGHTKPPRDDSKSNDNESHPLFVTQLVGSGRVLYSATDETWRWRYKQADIVHQRFWTQIAKWMMRAPYAIENEFVALDAGRMNYRLGQEIDLRCRLKNADGSPMKNTSVEAKIRNVDNDTITTMSMESDPVLPGVYRASTTNLPAGKYQVSISVAGMPEESLRIATEFVVQSVMSAEMTEMACNQETLKRVAQMSGGQFLPEQQISSLSDLLKPLSRGRIVQSELQLAQSYWWFMPIILLLGSEWWLRKRVGLI